MLAPSDHATLIVEVLIHDLGLTARDAVVDHRLKERHIAGMVPEEIGIGVERARGNRRLRSDAAGGGMFLPGLASKRELPNRPAFAIRRLCRALACRLSCVKTLCKSQREFL